MAQIESHIKLHKAITEGSLGQARRLINESLPPADVAHLLESAIPKQRESLWQLIDANNKGQVLAYLTEDLQSEFINRMDAEEVLESTENLDLDDLVDLLQLLPEAVMDEVLSSMTHQDRNRIKEALSYSEDTAGGMMNTDTLAVRPDVSLEVALRYLRWHDELPHSTDSLFVVTRGDILVGILSFNTLLVSSPSMTVREVMQTDFTKIPVDMPDTEVAALFEKQDLISAPVVDEESKLLGRITIDDVVDIIREDAEHTLMSMAGLNDEEDTFAPVLRTSKRRALWLGINLLTAFLASGVIGLFEGTIEKITALAVLMPIVASMGGIGGSQTLTVLIRAMALGHITDDKITWILRREFLVGAINGIIWAFVVGLLAMLWFGDIKIAWIIGAAIIINLLMAALAGTILPIILKKAKIDPALSGGVILTTVTDVVGFLAFLGLATAFYF